MTAAVARAVFFLLTLCLGVFGQDDLFEVTVTEELSPTDAEKMSVLPDMVEGIGDMAFNLDRNAVRNLNLTWPDKIVYYKLSSSYSQPIRNTIFAAMREIENDVKSNGKMCIQFKQKTSQQKNYILIEPNEGCYSQIGYQHKPAQPLSIGKTCELKGVVMHELIHTLGFVHEQQRYDRDKYVIVDHNNYPKNHTFDFVMMNDQQIQTFNEPYTYDSLMHYGPYMQAKDPSKPVLKPAPGKVVTGQMGQRDSLTASDVRRIQKLYNCPVDTTHITTPSKKQIVTQCTFDSNMCSLKWDSSSDRNWAVKKGKSAAGPYADLTTGGGGYLLAKASGHQGKKTTFVTPKFPAGSVCVEYGLFQKGPTSSLKVTLSGSRIKPVTFKDYKGMNNNYWYVYRTSLNGPPVGDMQLKFESTMSSGDVAIDDFRIYRGKCV